MPVVLVCNRFDGYKKDRLYTSCDLRDHLFAICWTYEQAIYILEKSRKSQIVFLKMEQNDLYVSIESTKRSFLV